MGHILGLRTRIKMKFLLLLLALHSVTSSKDTFLQFARDHAKTYSSIDEFKTRQTIFESNYLDMLEHNQRYEKGEVSWARKVTKFYDRTMEEFIADVGLGMPEIPNKQDRIDIESPTFMEKLSSVKGNAPSSFSWVDQGAVSPVKNQGQCGSCAAFATIATLETCYYLQTNDMRDLSEQHITDCANGHYYYDNDGTWGAFGCDGAWPQAYIDYLVNVNDGRNEEESCYPYTASDDQCKESSSCNYMGAHVTGMFNKWDTSEDDMKDLVLVNPVATNIQATYLGDYSHGVYDDNRCCEQDTDSNCKYNLNHEITVVGYGTEHGKDYWLIKNSWGTWFGDNGYFKIKRGTGHCGIGVMHQMAPYCAAN